MPIADSTAWIDARPLSAPSAPGDLVRWLLRGQRTSIAVGAVAGIVWMGAIAAVPFVLGRVIDAGIAAQDAGAVAVWLAALVGLGVVEALAGAVRHWHATSLYERSTLAVCELVARRGLDPGGGVERHVGPGEAVSLATSDADALGGPVDLMCRGTASVVTFAAVAAVVFAIAPALGLVLVAGLPLMLLAMVPLWRPLDRRSGARQQTLARASGLAADAVSGLATIKGLHGAPAARAGYRAGTGQVRGAALAVARLSAGWEALGVVVPGVFLAATAWIGGRLALEGAISEGELVACFGYAAFLVTPVRTFGEVAEVWAQAIASARRVVAVLNLEPDVREPAHPVPRDAATHAAVALDDVSNRPWVDGLTLDIAAGAHVGLAFAQPGGARAIADLLVRARDPAGGRVLLDGVDVRELALAHLRRAVGGVEHDAFLFAGTLRDNLLPAQPQATEAELHDALHVAAAGDLAATADGLERVVAERGRSLSGGERQRVALARAVLADPAVLVLDAPTRAVDAVTEQQIVARLLHARAGRTTIVLDPSPALAHALDEIALVERGGTVLARATHAQLLADSAAYRELVENT